VQVKDPGELAERVRADLGRDICDRFRDPTGRMRAIVLDPQLEVEFRGGLQKNGHIAMDFNRSQQLMQRLMTELKKANARGYEVPLLCDGSIRRGVRHAMARAITDLSVVAYQEIPTDLLMEPVTVIRPAELAAEPTGGSPFAT
jgi:flagellar biosynthesis protein FlhA